MLQADPAVDLHEEDVVALVGEGTAGVGEGLEVRIAGVVEIAIPVLLPDDEHRAARGVLPAHDTALDTLVPAQAGARSFAYPCYESWVGRGAERQSYVPVIASSFVGGRAGMEMLNDPRWVDLSYTRSFEMHGQGGAEGIRVIEDGIRRGHWVVLAFHGVGDDYIKTETDVFQEIVIYLARQKNRIWTDTFYEVASYIGDRQQDQVAK